MNAPFPQSWPAWFRSRVPLTTATIASAIDVRVAIRVLNQTRIEIAAQGATEIAGVLEVPVTFEFNGHDLVAFPGQAPEDVVAIYWARIRGAIADESHPDGHHHPLVAVDFSGNAREVSGAKS